jgi:hypothetical protein
VETLREKIKIMSSESRQEKCSALWCCLFESETKFIKARMDFLARSTDRAGEIHCALLNPLYRGTALRILPYLSTEERQQLFDDLLYLASTTHSDIATSREAILSLPREWVLANIESKAESLLRTGTYEEYRRLLELYIELDRGITEKLASRAVQSDDPDTREAGHDFLDRLRER